MSLIRNFVTARWLITNTMSKGRSEFEIPSIFSKSKNPNFDRLFFWNYELVLRKKKSTGNGESDAVILRTMSIDDETWGTGSGSIFLNIYLKFFAYAHSFLMDTRESEVEFPCTTPLFRSGTRNMWSYGS